MYREARMVSLALSPITIDIYRDFKGAVSRYSVIFCAFLREENGDCSRKRRGHQTCHHDSSAGSTNNFTAEAESRKCRFPRAIVISAALRCGRHYFSHTKWLPKITDYRDTAALK